MFPLAAIAAIPSIFQSIQGISQMIGGKKQLNNLERPVYEIPDAAKQSLALASSAFADPRMPGESQAYSRIGSAYSNYLRSAGETSNSLGGLASAQANTNRAYGDLATQSAAHQEGDRSRLMSNLGTYAQYQDAQWQMNKFSPYADAYNEGRERIGAGQQNLFGGLNGLSSIGMQFLAGRNAKPIDPAAISSATTSAKTSLDQDAFLAAAQRYMLQSSKPGYKPEGAGFNYKPL